MIKNILMKFLSIIGRSIKIIKHNSRIKQWKIPEETPYQLYNFYRLQIMILLGTMMLNNKSIYSLDNLR